MKERTLDDLIREQTDDFDSVLENEELELH
jgi:hypothetical protein